VDWLFDAYIGGESLQNLAEQLTARGVRSHRGEVRWTAARVGEILRNPVYRGKVVHGDDEYHGQHEALIGDERWRSVQQRLARRSVIHPRRRASLSLLF